ncbi:MAG: RHS repeat-associated core domain-containing protein, partial [Bacillota bacterium]
ITFADDNTNYLNGHIYPHAAYQKGIKPPFAKLQADGEEVSLTTGNLTLRETDLVLPGRNGLDLSITRYYSLNDSNLFEAYAKFYPESLEFGTAYFLDTYREKRFDIGAGWALDLPYIEIRNDYPYLHYGSAGVFPIDPVEQNNELILTGYELNDIKLKYDTTYYVGDIRSTFLLTEKSGKKVYFDDRGLLLSIKDRFDNEIKFYYTDRTNGYSSTYPVLSRIVDSLQRQINFQYIDNATENKVVISITDGSVTKTITYNKQKISDEVLNISGSKEYVLDNVIDAAGRVTRYGYQIETEVPLSFYRTSNHEVNNMYACLNRIQYPSLGETRYTYLSYMKNLGSNGSMMSFKVDTRYDLDSAMTPKNYRDYNYESYYYGAEYGGTEKINVEYDGYPAFCTYDSSQAIPPDFAIETKVLDSLGNIDTNFYNKDMLNTCVISEGANHKLEVTKEYDPNYKLLKKVKSKTYDKTTNNYITRIENFQYDNEGFRNLIGYWDVQSERDPIYDLPINNKYMTAYEYNPQYHYVTKKTYYVNDNMKVEEIFTPSSDNKTIAVAEVYEQYVLKKRTQFAYDSYGNVITECKYLDNWTDYVAVNYDYTDNNSSRNGQFNGAFLTRKWVDGVRDVDGNLVSARVGNTAGVVDEIFKYDYFGNVVERQDAMGYKTSYQYDNLNRITRQTNSDTTYSTISYNDANNTITTTNENGYSTTYIFGRLGNLLSEQDVTSGILTKTYTYDDYFRLKSEISSNGSFTEYNYLSDGKVSSKQIKDKDYLLLYQETYEYREGENNGLYTKINKKILGDSNSPTIETNTYVNKVGKVEKLERIHNENGTLKTYVDTYKYDYVGNKIEEKNARAYEEGWSQSYTNKYVYNYAGQVKEVYDINGDYASTEYDALGRVKSVTDSKGNKAAAKYSKLYTYDSLGRVLMEKTPIEQIPGIPIFRYSFIKYKYDLNGNVISTMTSKNKPTEELEFSQVDYEYNNRGMLTKVTNYAYNNTPNYSQYYYDNVGNKVRMYTGLVKPLIIQGLDNVTATGDSNYSVTRYLYNQFNQMIKRTDPLGKHETYEYDNAGNLKTKTDRNGNTTTFAYDGLNRMISKSVTNPSDTAINSTYAYSYSMTGSLKSTSGGGSAVSYTYDDLGRLVQETEENNIIKQYSYDAVNNRKSFTLKQNGAIKLNNSYTYDNLNRLYQVYDNSQLSATYQYDANGNRSLLTYANGIVTEYTYNLTNNILSLTNKKNSNIVSQFTYTYYSNGNIESKTDSNGKTSYTYDNSNRLEREIHPNGQTTQYWYDDYGNRSYMMVLGAGINVVYNYDKNNRLLLETKTEGEIKKVTKYTYDNNGNQIFKAVETIKPVNSQDVANHTVSVSGQGGNNIVEINEYDGFNQLIKSTTGSMTIVYTYKSDGLRASKSVNGNTTVHIWDGDQIALELDEAGNEKGKYVRGINLISAEINGAKNFYLYNAHGDVEQLTSSIGDVIKDYEYDAFGVEQNIDPNDSNPFRYCGEYFDKETGTIYLRARYYDPAIGRFISEDSYLGRIEDPLSLNLYTYCHNNPIIFEDPSGNVTIAIGGNAAAAFVVKAGVSVQIAIDGYGNVALLVTLQGGAGTPTANAGGNLSITNADNVKDLKGFSGEIGGSVGIAGAELVSGDGYQGLNINIGIGTPIPEAHGELTYTWVIILDSSKFDEIKKEILKELDNLSDDDKKAIEKELGVSFDELLENDGDSGGGGSSGEF